MKKLFFIATVLALALGGSYPFPSLLFAQRGWHTIKPVPPKNIRPIISCGDKRVEGSEECDDGNRTSGDGCSSKCRREKSCLSGIFGKGDVCIPPPKPPRNPCGNGRLDTGEGCDDGNTVNTDSCRNNCQRPRCGDGLVDAPAEQCDDGNLVAGDGCSAKCQNEPRCGDGTVNEGEECDDGNTTSGDGCSNTCTTDCACGWAKEAETVWVISGATDIVLDAEGNSYVIGYEHVSESESESNIWINKYDVCGNEISPFPIIVSSSVNDFGTGITFGSDGFLYATGGKRGDIWIAKLATDGSVAWEKTLLANWGSGQDIMVDPDLNIFVTGKRNDHLWIGKLRENVDGTSADLLDEVVEDTVSSGQAITLDAAEQSIYVSGSIPRELAGYYLWVNKYSSIDLAPLWAGPVNGSSFVEFLGLGSGILLRDGTLYIGGGHPAWIRRFNPTDGTLLADPIGLSTTSNSIIRDMLIVDGSIFLTGFKYPNFWVAKWDSVTEAILWEDFPATDIGAYQADGFGLARHSDGSLYVAGLTRRWSDGRYMNYYIRKYCPSEIDESAVTP